MGSLTEPDASKPLTQVPWENEANLVYLFYSL